MFLSKLDSLAAHFPEKYPFSRSNLRIAFINLVWSNKRGIG